MRKYVVFTLCVLPIFLGLIINAKISEKKAWTMPVSNVAEQPIISEEELFDSVNNYRKEKALAVLTKSVTTCGIATIRLDEIKADWSHNQFFPIATMNNRWGYFKIGENLSRDFKTEYLTLQKWLDSPTHKENLDYPYTESCIRCEGTRCVQIFASY